MILVPDADDEGGCCERALMLICPQCALSGFRTMNAPHPDVFHEPVVIIR